MAKLAAKEDTDWRSTPEKNGKGLEVSVRDWGNWKTPGDVHGSDAEDYDWQEFTELSHKKLKALIATVSAKHKGVEITYDAGEKTGCTFCKTKMKLKDLTIKVPVAKPRNPNQEVLAAKRNAGGPMRDKRREQKAGGGKHVHKMYEVDASFESDE
jgi:hypothetical protein